MSNARLIQRFWIEIGNIVREVGADTICVAARSHFDGLQRLRGYFANDLGEGLRYKARLLGSVECFRGGKVMFTYGNYC